MCHKLVEEFFEFLEGTSDRFETARDEVRVAISKGFEETMLSKFHFGAVSWTTW